MKMSDDDKKILYKDALYWHFISEGYSEFQAKAKAERAVE